MLDSSGRGVLGLASSDLDRVLVVGDCHGDTHWVTMNVIPTAVEWGCKLILQLGDYGEWSHHIDGLKYHHRVSHALVESGVTLAWVDGNHENFDIIERVYTGVGEARLLPTSIRENLYYLPRGCKFVVGGVKFLACGGAYSVDQALRVPGYSWWAQEMITDKDVRTCIAQGKADVVLSHDAPFDYPILTHKSSEEPNMRENRRRLTQVVRSARPSIVMHGHWHTHYNEFVEGTRVVCLDMNRRPYNMALLGLPRLDVTPLP